MKSHSVHRSARCPSGGVLLGPDGLAVVGMACAPPLGELGDEKKAAAALVENAGPTHVWCHAAGVGDLAPERAVVDQPQVNEGRP